MASLRSAIENEVLSLNPSGLFERGDQPSEASDAGVPQWWAIHTLARQEKSLARDLCAMGLSYYLPLVETTKVYRRNRVCRQLPLFPGYLFLHGTDDDRVQSLTTNRVSKVLPVSDTERICRELSDLHRLISSGFGVTAETQLSPGDRVRIKVGPMRGIEGVVFRRRSVTRLQVSVHFLQRGASIEVDQSMLESISSA